ncbi:MAG: citrate synthase [archaeon]|nr:citrate synthase [archaeon]
MKSYEDFLTEHADMCRESAVFPSELYAKHDVKKGLRDSNGKGVVAGLTNISRVIGTRIEGGEPIPVEGSLQYRGYAIEDLIKEQGDKPGLFEKTIYLLLFDRLPGEEELVEFRHNLSNHFTLPVNFVKEVIMRDNGHDVMNTLSRGILSLGLYAEDLNDMSPRNALDNCINIIAKMPCLAAYGHQAYSHYAMNGGFHILNPNPELTVAENMLRMLTGSDEISELDALVLDRILFLHMEHGGGNNSAFTARVVSSSGSDTYSVIAAALLSLKGPKHGGANHKVAEMARNIRSNVKDVTDPDQMKEYLGLIADKMAFDRRGLIYGMGHAVYTLSDPRATVMRELARKLAEAKGRMEEFTMYSLIEELSPDIIRGRHNGGPVCANIDLYSGFAYDMLGIPEDLYTPMFAVARSVGWCAHHLEEILSSNKIIRPAYVSVVVERGNLTLD